MAGNDKRPEDKKSKVTAKIPDRCRFFSFQKVYKEGENLYYVIVVETLLGKVTSVEKEGPFYMFEAESRFQKKLFKYKLELAKNQYLQEEIELDEYPE